MNTQTSERLNNYNITPHGEGNFSVYDLKKPGSQIFSVKISENYEVRCNCDENRRYRFRCIHMAAVLTYISKTLTLPENVEIPDPLDVEQMNHEDIQEYLLRINKALNLLNVRCEESITEQMEASMALTEAKLKKKTLKDHKAEEYMIEEAQNNETASDNRTRRAKLEVDIIKGRMKVLEGSRMIAMGILKKLP